MALLVVFANKAIDRMAPPCAMTGDQARQALGLDLARETKDDGS